MKPFAMAVMLAVAGTPSPAASTDPALAILDQARGTPAEIFADIAFRLLDGDKIPVKDRIALLEEIYLRASEARDPLPLRPAVIAPVGGKPVMAAKGLGLHLDTLSIRCRVAQKLLALDGQRARQRFADIAPPDTPKYDCQSAVIADPTIYFETLAAVVAQAPFTAEEQKKQVPFWMVEGAVRGIRTSLEIIAAARNFPQLVHGEKEASALAGAFGIALGIDDSNRNFTAAAQRTNLVGAVLAANDRLSSLGAPPQTMLAALRGYLVRHLTAARCADSIVYDYAASVDAFHAALAKRTVPPPISDAEMQPAKSEGEADLGKPGDQASYREMAADVEALGPDRLPRTTTPIRPEIALQAHAVLAELAAWKGSADQGAMEVFHQKAGFYAILMQRFLLSDIFPSIVSGFVATLRDGAILGASPRDWLSEVEVLQIRDTMTGARTRNGVTEFYWARTDEGAAPVMAASGFPALAAYGQLILLDRKY